VNSDCCGMKDEGSLDEKLDEGLDEGLDRGVFK
jgi:hypothetical protein